MLNKHGFTLIEVIFSMSIIIVLSLFTLRLTTISPLSLSIDEQCTLIMSLLQEAKYQALLNHSKVEIIIQSQKIGYQYPKEHFLELNANYQFENSFELSFNKNGNINAGNTLKICDLYTCRSIVFNVGSGVFYVKE